RINMKDRYLKSKKVSLISLIVNIILTLIKIIIGFFFQSKALIADGIHSLSDVASTLIILISIKYSHTKADQKHPYGHGKAEAIGTIILGFILIITGITLIRETIYNIILQKIYIPGNLTLIAAILSIITKEGLYRYTLKMGKKINNKALIADANHHRSDAFSSIAALIGIMGSKLGINIFDPLAGLIVSLFIGKIGFDISREAIHELMDGIPSEEKIENISKQTGEISEIISVKDIKIRTYGPKQIVDLVISVNSSYSIEKAHEVAVKAQEKIIRLNPDIKEVFVHIDPEPES
ncbi:MAG: cation diffusion facilitator family transporter, partial [Halanaerobiaceae bacterium]